MKEMLTDLAHMPRFMVLCSLPSLYNAIESTKGMRFISTTGSLLQMPAISLMLIVLFICNAVDWMAKGSYPLSYRSSAVGIATSGIVAMSKRGNSLPLSLALLLWSSASDHFEQAKGGK